VVVVVVIVVVIVVVVVVGIEARVAMVPVGRRVVMLAAPVAPLGPRADGQA
jgi:hypothetical protein